MLMLLLMLLLRAAAAAVEPEAGSAACCCCRYCHRARAWTTESRGIRGPLVSGHMLDAARARGVGQRIWGIPGGLTYY